MLTAEELWIEVDPVVTSDDEEESEVEPKVEATHLVSPVPSYPDGHLVQCQLPWSLIHCVSGSHKVEFMAHSFMSCPQVVPVQPLVQLQVFGEAQIPLFWQLGWHWKQPPCDTFPSPKKPFGQGEQV